MKPFSFYIGVALIVLCALASYASHRYVHTRLRQAELLQERGQRLAEMPADNIGPWRLAAQQQLSEDVQHMLECSGYIHRIYINDLTGHQANVFVAVGPQGPMSVHTPDVCFRATDYFQAPGTKPEHLRLPDRDDTFWGLWLAHHRIERNWMRTVHAWSRGERWEAPEEPRIHFLGAPFLYRILVAVPVDPEEAADQSSDPARAFLEVFLPELEKYVGG